ncbi:MAG: pH regulation protein F [Acidobacteria bacterium]|nr:pH regulation protein F [Acidobacteriota bacterium]
MRLFLNASGLIMFILMTAILYRVARGPTVIDRIVSANMIGTKTTVLLVIIGSLFSRVEMYVDFALTYALLNFIGSIAAAKFFQHRRLSPEHDEEVL